MQSNVIKSLHPLFISIGNLYSQCYFTQVNSFFFFTFWVRIILFSLTIKGKQIDCNGKRKDRRENREEGKWEPESAWMPSAAAEWHFIGICQLNSDWSDIANPSRCSALTDECVTVSCGTKRERLWGCRGWQAQGKQGLSGTTVHGIWRDLEDRMIRHPGIRWHRVQIVSTTWDRGFTHDFPSPRNLQIRWFVWLVKEMSD